VTSVDDTFLDGPIGPDVVEVADKHDSHWLQLIDRTWRFADDETASPVSLQDLVTFGAPLTVTAVREQPAIEVVATSTVGGAKVPVYAAREQPAEPRFELLTLPPGRGLVLAACGHWWRETRPPGAKVRSGQPRVCAACPPGVPNTPGRSEQGLSLVQVEYVEETAPEPQQADASPVLDLVQQYGAESYEQGVAAGQRSEGAEDHYDDKARALFARIAALVPQQPVGGDPALERSRHEPHVDGPREPSAQERADHELMTALGVDRLEDVLPAIERLKAEGEDWMRRFREQADRGDQAAQQILTLHRERNEAASARDAAIDALIKTRAEREAAEREVERYRRLLKSQASNFAAATAAQPDSLVLSLPEVPEGAVALRGETTGHRWTETEFGRWVDEETGQVRGFLQVLEREHVVRVELAPPREPRTWPKPDDAPKDLRAVQGASGRVYRPHDQGEDALWYWRDEFGTRQGFEPFANVQYADGPLTEVTE
jgi:hypothetical protein